VWSPPPSTQPEARHGIVRNVTYRGVLRWNRSKWSRDPETKRRTYQLRDESEHVESLAPELRIASDEPLAPVQARHAEKHAASVNIRAALHSNARTAQPEVPALGLLICGKCAGASWPAVAGVARPMPAPRGSMVAQRPAATRSACRVAWRSPSARWAARRADHPGPIEQFKLECGDYLMPSEIHCVIRTRTVSRLAELIRDWQPHGRDCVGRAAAPRLAPGCMRESERATLAARTEARTAKIADFLPARADYGRLVADLETLYSEMWTAPDTTYVPCWSDPVDA